MTRNDRIVFLRSAALGVFLTCVVLSVHVGHYLQPLENWFYDERVRIYQFHNPPPTDKLVHVDIDDASLNAIGRWPWPRARIAEVIEEIATANPKVVGLDILFPEADRVEYQKRPDGSIVAIDNDEQFKQALKKCRQVLLPISLSPQRDIRPTASFQARLDILRKDLELLPEEVDAKLNLKQASGANAIKEAEAEFIIARRKAIYERVYQELNRESTPFEQIRLKIFPKIDPTFTGHPLLRELREQYDKVRAIVAMRAFSRTHPQGAPAMLDAEDETPVTPAISGVNMTSPTTQATTRAVATTQQRDNAITYTGFVDYPPPPVGGVVRYVPLWMNEGGRLFPQIGMSLAAATMDVPIKDIRITEHDVTFPRPGKKDIVIPIDTRNAAKGRVGALFDIPYFGGAHWETMYDFPKHEKFNQHLSIKHIYAITQTRQRILTNNANADHAIVTLLGDDGPTQYQLDPAKARAYLKNLPPLADTDARVPTIDMALGALKESGWIEGFEQLAKEGKLDDKDRLQLDQVTDCQKTLTTIVAQNRLLEQQLREQRGELQTKLSDKAVLIGWVATGRTDFVPTSLWPNCPGVVIHGVVFNGIMTGEMWRRVPLWVDLLIVAAIGLVTTLITAGMGASKALLSTVLLFAGYMVLNGLVLFDQHNYIVSVAGPFSAAIVVWGGMTMTRFVLESREKARITKRFRSYVDPSLVDYCNEHVDKLHFEGEKKELSVVFTDLQGFTTISEMLQERTVPLLNEYFGLMVPVIREYKGYLNKFLGDGIMFINGAPQDNPKHAVLAVSTVLEMQKIMIGFNESLKQRELPPVVMRAGIVTGVMVVGDAGPGSRSDYTVIGDNVNLAARLESANKAFGTRILCTERTVDLLEGKYLVRPIAKLRVKGKMQSVMTYEPLCALDQATPEIKRLQELTSGFVAPFLAGDFNATWDALDLARAENGAVEMKKMIDLYCRNTPPRDTETPAKYEGVIALADK